ncbi:MAG: dihydrolipoyl dehydrogenase [Muribaculaceae bacterium]|nr:dihydrolipoyl dehydrogenase [Muribaculaceae bacterium]
MTKADIIIIGAGPGGYETALEAAHRGKQVILFEGRKLGGTCLNEGCIPTKCFCRNAEVLSQFKEAEAYGIDDFTFEFDFNKVIERKNQVVSTLRDGIKVMLDQAKVTVVPAFASFKDAHTVVADGEEYTAENIIIATGSVSKSLPIPGADLDCVKTSTEMLDIEYVPASLTVVGGGVIGMEFASIFAAMGSQVTVVEYCKQILPPFDSDIAKRLKQNLSKRGIKIVTSAAVKSIEQNDDYEIVTTYECKGKEEQIISSDILMAVGRAPRFDGLNLEATGVEFTQRGIKVDDYMRTNIPHIFAIGDVNARMMLAHVASFQGIRALNAIEGKSDTIDFNLVPSAVFTQPECGMVGLTTEQCKDQGIAVKTGTSFFRANGKALTLGEPDGLCKLIFRADDMTLIGAHIMGVQAADLAQQCADMMNQNITADGIKNTIFSPPTVSEVILQGAHNIK